MNIIKDRAIWIVLVLIIMAGIGYMLVVDPDRVDKMDNIVERDDEREADVNETNELIDRIDKRLIGTKKHLANLWTLTENHIKTYDSKVDSINNAFSQLDMKLDKFAKDMKKGFADLGDQLEDLEDDLSSLKTQSKRDLRKVNAKINELEDNIKTINTKLEEED